MKKLLVGMVPVLLRGMIIAQDGVRSDIHLFQNFFEDGLITENIYVEGLFQHNGYDGFNINQFGAAGGMPINENLEICGALGFSSMSPEHGDSESGLNDILFVGRYNLDGILPEGSRLTAGGSITLPIGEEKVGQGHLNFGGFMAARHPLNQKAVVTGTAGLLIYETTDNEGKDDRETALRLGGGAIIPVNDELTAVAELVMLSKGDYMVFTGGADYAVGPGKLRAAIGLGLDDGAPDFSMQIAFLMDL